MNIWANLAQFGVPTAFTGFMFALLIRRMNIDRDERKERDAAQLEQSCLAIGMSNANMELSEVTAIALKNGKFNGEVESALETVRTVKRKYREFLDKQAMENLR